MAQLPKRKFRSGKPTNEMRALSDMFLSIAVVIQSWLFDNDRVASGKTINSIRIDVFKKQIVMTADQSIKFALEGRGPGGFPWDRDKNVNPLEEWIRQKPIQIPPGFTVESLAFVMGRSIALSGTDKPHLTPEDLAGFIQNGLRKHQKQVADKYVSSVVDGVVEKFEQVFLKNPNLSVTV